MIGISKCGAREYDYGNEITEKKVIRHRQFFKNNEAKYLQNRFEKWMEREEIKRSNLLLPSKLKGVLEEIEQEKC